MFHVHLYFEKMKSSLLPDSDRAKWTYEIPCHVTRIVDGWWIPWQFPIWESWKTCWYCWPGFQTCLHHRNFRVVGSFAVYIHLRDILVSFDDIISLLVYSLYSSLSRVNVRTSVYSEPIQIHPPQLTKKNDMSIPQMTPCFFAVWIPCFQSRPCCYLFLEVSWGVFS